MSGSGWNFVVREDDLRQAFADAGLEVLQVDDTQSRHTWYLLRKLESSGYHRAAIPRQTLRVGSEHTCRRLRLEVLAEKALEELGRTVMVDEVGRQADEPVAVLEHRPGTSSGSAPGGATPRLRLTSPIP